MLKFKHNCGTWVNRKKNLEQEQKPRKGCPLRGLMGSFLAGLYVVQPDMPLRMFVLLLFLMPFDQIIPYQEGQTASAEKDYGIQCRVIHYSCSSLTFIRSNMTAIQKAITVKIHPAIIMNQLSLTETNCPTTNAVNEYFPISYIAFARFSYFFIFQIYHNSIPKARTKTPEGLSFRGKITPSQYSV